MKKKQTSQHFLFPHFTKTYFEEIQHCLEALDVSQLELATNMIVDAYHKDKQIFIFGNGGSASTASHFACDLGKNTLQRVYDFKEKRGRVISLTDNVALITAFSNDVSYEDVFAQELRNLLKKDDVVIGISGSGNSKNVVNAVKYAKQKKAKTIGFLGFKTGGKLKELCDASIIIDSNHYGPIEDVHLLLTHLISSWVSYVIHAQSKKNKLPYKNDIFVSK